MNTRKRNFKRQLVRGVRRAIRWGDRRIPFGVRSVLGVLLTIAGLFGFLPILGFWMIPAGLGLIALDVPPLRRRMLDWIDRMERDLR